MVSAIRMHFLLSFPSCCFFNHAEFAHSVLHIDVTDKLE